MKQKISCKKGRCVDEEDFMTHMQNIHKSGIVDDIEQELLMNEVR